MVACSLFVAAPLTAGDKPTSLSDAKAAIEANLRTSEGKAFDDRLGTEFMQKHLASLRQCKASTGENPENFWMLMRLGKDGAVQEILLYPTTKLGSCARDAYLKETFLPPPKPDYWVGVYLNLKK